MKSLFKAFIFLLAFGVAVQAPAQCVMCRTQVVNNVSHGETALAAGLNFGIIYLFVVPYVVLGVVACLWFRNSKVNERKTGLVGRIAG